MTMTINIPSGKKISKNKIEGVRKLAHKNMRLIMKKLEFKGEDQGARLVGCCPVPHNAGKTPNDNRKAFSWDFSRQMWQCFSHHCHTIYGADVFALIRSVKECSFKQALQWILDVIEKDIDDVRELDPEEALKLEQVIRKRAQLVKHKRMEEDLMRHLKPSTYFKDRGFSNEVILEFGCGGEWHKTGTYGENRVVVPIHDPMDGYLIAFTCRLLDDSHIETWRPKWCHALNFAEKRKKSSERTDEERFHASSVLFNLHRARNHMGERGTIILVEGCGDVMRMWEAGLKNTVAVLGTGFSKHHRTLLHKVGCSRVVSALDGDEAGQKAANSVKRLCENYFDHTNITLPSGQDPGDHAPEQLRLIFKEYL
jgi:5S rRNA maturation endonuclease (ribonuclease M5)